MAIIMTTNEPWLLRWWGELRMSLRNFLDSQIMKSGPEDSKRKINGPK